MVLVFGLYALLASTFTLGKMLLFFLPPFMLIAVRMLLAGSLSLGLYFILHKEKMRLAVSDWLILGAISFIHILIPYTSEFVALQHIEPACAALVYNLCPFFTALFSYIVFDEKMTLQKWVGFGLGLIGISYFIQPDIWCWNLSFDSSYTFLLISVISSTFAWVVIRYFVKQKGVSILFINGIAMLLASLESFVISRSLEGAVSLPWYDMQNFLVLLGLVILFANIMFYNLYGYLLKKYTATFLAFVGFVTPLFTAMYDWLFLGHIVSVHFFVSVAIVACGIYLFYKEELKQGYIIS